MDPSYTHGGSRANLIGENPSAELQNKFCNELQVTPDTPKAFIMLSSDDADLIGIHIPLCRMTAYKPYGLLRISQRYFMVALRQTILKYHISYALSVEPLGHIVTFMTCCKPAVTTSGTHDYSLSVLKMYADDAAHDFKIKDVKVKNSTTVPMEIFPDGGVVIVAD